MFLQLEFGVVDVVYQQLFVFFSLLGDDMDFTN
jgi:hypothetical protein